MNARGSRRPHLRSDRQTVGPLLQGVGSNPREPEGPARHLLNSLKWGAAASIAGGLAGSTSVPGLAAMSHSPQNGGMARWTLAVAEGKCCGVRWNCATSRNSARNVVRSCAIGIMAKVPRSGRVKTRLVPPLTHDQASALSGCFLRDVSAAIVSAAAAGTCPLIHGAAAYLPVGDEQGFEGLLPPDFLLLPQRGVDLGERLFHAITDLLTAGFDAACLVNSDSPTLPPSLLRDAALALDRPGDRVVLGPASDGGYYLIGLKRAHRELFEHITWSTPAVLSETLERARALSLEVNLLDEWYDVDDGASLRMLCQELFGHTRTGDTNGRGTSSRELLENLLKEIDFRLE